MKNKGFNRREFIKIAAGSAVVMLGSGGSAVFAKGERNKSRSYYKVFSKGKIGNLRIKNRLVKAASATAATTDDCHFLSGGVDMYRNWSKGGVGLINTGHMTVAPIPKGAYNHALTCIYDDKFIPQVMEIADAVHNADCDCKIIAQINHLGMRSSTNPIAPSSVPWPNKKKKPHALFASEVQEIIALYVAAARRAREAGFDGVEIHCAHGFLLNTFLSPYTNKRADKYGGSVQNRVRIIGEIVDGIKTSVDPDFPVLIKTNSDDGMGDAGINIDNFPQLADELVKTGIDAIEISGAKPAREDLDEPEKQSYFAVYAEKLNVDIPVITTGGNKSIDVVEKICQRGKVDYFGFARPLILEPDLPKRWLEMVGDVECDCISCNQCLVYLHEGNKLVTCQNI